MTRWKCPRVIYLPDGPVSNWRRRPSRKLLLGAGGAMLALAGCTTFGTNIKGSFACGAPGDGSCAPATVIDDRALAEITGDASYIPAGPYRAPPSFGPQEMAPQAIVAHAALPADEAVPVGQKILRIVFPAHVDRAGRFHETSVVKAVVDNGAWMQASANHGAALAQTVNLTVNPDILSQLDAGLPAREQAASATTPRMSLADPGAPSPEAVAAARARAAETRSAPTSGQGTGPDAPVNRPASFHPIVED